MEKEKKGKGLTDDPYAKQDEVIYYIKIKFKLLESFE